MRFSTLSVFGVRYNHPSLYKLGCDVHYRLTLPKFVPESSVATHCFLVFDDVEFERYHSGVCVGCGDSLALGDEWSPVWVYKALIEPHNAINFFSGAIDIVDSHDNDINVPLVMSYALGLTKEQPQTCASFIVECLSLLNIKLNYCLTPSQLADELFLYSLKTERNILQVYNV